MCRLCQGPAPAPRARTNEVLDALDRGKRHYYEEYARRPAGPRGGGNGVCFPPAARGPKVRKNQIDNLKRGRTRSYVLLGRVAPRPWRARARRGGQLPTAAPEPKSKGIRSRVPLYPTVFLREDYKMFGG